MLELEKLVYVLCGIYSLYCIIIYSVDTFVCTFLQYCSGCGQLAALDSPVVYAERAGYDRLWHPTCFVCAECGEMLVDLVYFWKKDNLLCGRHYCQSLRPRCSGCDEVSPGIFAKSGS